MVVCDDDYCYFHQSARPQMLLDDQMARATFHGHVQSKIEADKCRRTSGRTSSDP